MPPGRRLAVFFDSAVDRLQTDLPLKYEATVEYSDAHGRRQPSLRYIVDIGHLVGQESITEHTVHDAANALRGIEKTVKKWTGRQDRLNVWMKDEDDLNESERIEHALTGRWPSLGRSSPSTVAMWAGRNVFVRSALEWYRDRQDAQRRAAAKAKRVQPPDPPGD